MDLFVLLTAMRKPTNSGRNSVFTPNI